VERNLEILSEASRRLPKELKELEAHIQWRAIPGIGNVLRHDYHETYPTVLWDTCNKDLKPLKDAVERIEKRIGPVSGANIARQANDVACEPSDPVTGRLGQSV
jgi:uncharacterized protein with HEPN domain